MVLLTFCTKIVLQFNTWIRIQQLDSLRIYPDPQLFVKYTVLNCSVTIVPVAYLKMGIIVGSTTVCWRG
jgi:hypothetical protein